MGEYGRRKGRSGKGRRRNEWGRREMRRRGISRSRRRRRRRKGRETSRSESEQQLI